MLTILLVEQSSEEIITEVQTLHIWTYLDGQFVNAWASICSAYPEQGSNCYAGSTLLYPHLYG